MDSNESTCVIVGASHASVQAIDTLRREGFKGAIVLVGDEPYLPYNRPPLSKKYLACELERERLWLRSGHFYQQHRVDTRLGAPWREAGRALRAKHPALAAFLGAATTALVRVEIEEGVHVGGFQRVTTWRPGP